MFCALQIIAVVDILKQYWLKVEKASERKRKEWDLLRHVIMIIKMLINVYISTSYVVGASCSEMN